MFNQPFFDDVDCVPDLEAMARAFGWRDDKEADAQPEAHPATEL